MIKQNDKGFTLPELLITCILISILSIGIAAFLTGWLQNYATTSARTDLLTNAEDALGAINQDIRLSGSTDTNNRWADANAPNGDYSWTSDANTLILAKAALDKDNDILFSDPNNYITKKNNEVYFVQNKNLYRRTLASDDSNDRAKTTCPKASASASCPADLVVATGVTNFSVKYYDADENQVSPNNARSIGLAITLEAKNGSNMITTSYSTRMVFRND